MDVCSFTRCSVDGVERRYFKLWRNCLCTNQINETQHVCVVVVLFLPVENNLRKPACLNLRGKKKTLLCRNEKF